MGWGFKRMNYFSFNRGVERSTFLKQKYLNAPHVSDRGRLHVVQNLSSFTTIHKIWQAGFDHGSYCYRKNIVLPSSCSKTRTKQIVMFILKQKQKRINRRRDACQKNCSEQRSRVPLDNGTPCRSSEAEIRSTHAGLAGLLVCKVCKNVVLSPYPTKPVQFEGREAGWGVGW